MLRWSWMELDRIWFVFYVTINFAFFKSILGRISFLISLIDFNSNPRYKLFKRLHHIVLVFFWWLLLFGNYQRWINFWRLKWAFSFGTTLAISSIYDEAINSNIFISVLCINLFLKCPVIRSERNDFIKL